MPPPVDLAEALEVEEEIDDVRVYLIPVQVERKSMAP